MLKKSFRLAKKRDFNLVLSHGQWVRGENLSLKTLDLAKNQKYFPPKEDAEEFKKQLKIAVSVGLKISKKAVERNRLRRQINEIIRLLMKNQQIPSGKYVLIVPSPKAKVRNYQELSQEMIFLLRRANLFLPSKSEN